MTDDLVKRLRSKNCCDATKCNCDEAADRIEVLEAALREIEMLHYDSETDFHHDAMKAHDIARAALAGEKNGKDATE